MKDHIQIGNLGEEVAVDFLKKRGYTILERNWRFSRAEIDIICKFGDILVFVEVKARSYDFYGTPEAFVDDKKETLLADAANEYMKQVNHEWEFRFDIIGIVFQSKSAYTIKHIEDAFFGGIE